MDEIDDLATAIERMEAAIDIDRSRHNVGDCHPSLSAWLREAGWSQDDHGRWTSAQASSGRAVHLRKALSLERRHRNQELIAAARRVIAMTGDDDAQTD